MLSLKAVDEERSILADAIASIANAELRLLEAARKVQRFGERRAFANAKKAAAAEFQRSGFNPQELMKKLKINIKRAVYNRSPY
jgi:hypothetical protein